MGEILEVQFTKQKRQLIKRNKESEIIKIDTAYLLNRIEQSRFKVNSDDPNVLFNVGAKEVWQVLKEIDSLKNEILSDYKKEIQYAKGYLFPHDWMLKRKSIRDTFRDYPLLLPLLNYIYYRNDKAKIEDIQYMKSISGGYVIKPKEDKSYPASVFIADNIFYTKASKYLGCSMVLLKKYIGVLMKEEFDILRKVKKYRGNTNILCDGYFIVKPGSRRKISLLTNRAKCRKCLMEFNPYK